MLSTPIIRTLFLALILISGCSTESQLPRLAPDARILAFGDSLTFGTGTSNAQSYPAILQRLSGYQVINAGVPGETSDQGLARLPQELDETAPSLLLLCHGGNDMLRQLDRNRTKSNLQTMIRLAQERDIAVVLIGVPRPGLLLGTAELYKQVAAETGVPMESQALADILGQRQLKSDQIHPNAQGYLLLAEAIYQLLQDRGAL